MATSSMMSHSWKISGLVGGTCTKISSWFVGETEAVSAMHSKNVTTSEEESDNPLQELI